MANVVAGISLAHAGQMSRDYRTLRVFNQANALVTRLYPVSKSLPREEIYGLQSQMRRAAVSVATNIVEGSVKRSEKSWVQFLEVSLGSACETRYLIELAVQLGLLSRAQVGSLAQDYSDLIAGIQALISSMPAGQRIEN